MRFLTAGESHGKCLTAILEGVPCGFNIDENFINSELKRRQSGYGRGGRMSIETDKIEIKAGVRFGKTTGAPICLEIQNKDWENWQIPMSTRLFDTMTDAIKTAVDEKKIRKVRPGHADFAGAVKYDVDDIRNILERSSARETAIRTAIGAVSKSILSEFGIKGFSHVTQISAVQADTEKLSYEEIQARVSKSEVMCADYEAETKIKNEIDRAKEAGDTLGGEFEIIFTNLPVGLGSHVHWDRKLDGLLAQALMSIPAVKSVEIGMGKDCAIYCGSKVHDEIFFEDGVVSRKTNNAGGLEGGMTNGSPLVIRAVMKPIPTMKTPLKSIDFFSKTPENAHFERSDTCAVPACAVVAESACAYILANAFLEKFGGDNFDEIQKNYSIYKQKVNFI